MIPQLVLANTYSYTGIDQNSNTVDYYLNNDAGLTGEAYNQTTGDSYSIDTMYPNETGGLSGTMYNYNTGRFADINIDQYNNIDIWEY